MSRTNGAARSCILFTRTVTMGTLTTRGTHANAQTIPSARRLIVEEIASNIGNALCASSWNAPAITCTATNKADNKLFLEKVRGGVEGYIVKCSNRFRVVPSLEQQRGDRASR